MDLVNIIFTFFLTVALTCSIMALLFAALAYVEVKALQKSTHSVQFMPMDPKWASTEEDMRQKLEADDAPLQVDESELDESELDLRKMI